MFVIFLFRVNYYGDNFVRASGEVKDIAASQCRLIWFTNVFSVRSKLVCLILETTF